MCIRDSDKTVRDNFELKEIPESMKAEAAEWRAKLIEEVAATDDALMEKFFEDPDSITAEELLAAIRKATISMQVVPMLCGSSFHNKGVQKLLDYVMAFLPSPLDVPAVTGDVYKRQLSPRARRARLGRRGRPSSASLEVRCKTPQGR